MYHLCRWDCHRMKVCMNFYWQLKWILCKHFNFWVKCTEFPHKKNSKEDDFKILSVYFLNFVKISPLKRAGPFFCIIWYNLPSHLRNQARHLNNFESPSPKDAFLSSLVEISSVVLEKKIKMWKVYDNDDDG